LTNFAFKATARANISYVSTDGAGNQRIVGPTPTSLNLIASQLANGETTYTHLTVEAEAEEVPMGLAAEIYASLSVLQYEGTVKNTQAEVPSDIGIGQNLNLTGGASAWASMNAQIQQIDEDVDAGETTITIGPAKHLGGDDLLEQTRAQRNWNPAAYRNERLTAQPDGIADMSGTTDQKGEGFGTAADLPKLALKSGSFVLTIDHKDLSALGTLPSNLTLKPRVEQRSVVAGGVCTTKNVIVLMSEPY
jgi:hypothetical protein